MIKIHMKQNINYYLKKSVDLKYLNDSKAFIEYSNDMDRIYKKIEHYNPNKKGKLLIAFDGMIADIMTIDDKIRDEKLQYDINREVAKY